MNDLGKLYNEHQKMVKIIDSCLEYKTDDEGLQKFINKIYGRNRYQNKFQTTIISMTDLREICSQWMEKILDENHIKDGGSLKWDRFCWFLKGKYKERKRFLRMFVTVFGDIKYRLDDIDGSEIVNEFGNSKRVGFSM